MSRLTPPSIFGPRLFSLLRFVTRTDAKALLILNSGVPVLLLRILQRLSQKDQVQTAIDLAVFGLADVDNALLLIGRFLCHLSRFSCVIAPRHVELLGFQTLFTMVLELPHSSHASATDRDRGKNNKPKTKASFSSQYLTQTQRNVADRHPPLLETPSEDTEAPSLPSPSGASPALLPNNPSPLQFSVPLSSASPRPNQSSNNPITLSRVGSFLISDAENREKEDQTQSRGRPNFHLSLSLSSSAAAPGTPARANASADASRPLHERDSASAGTDRPRAAAKTPSPLPGSPNFDLQFHLCVVRQQILVTVLEVLTQTSLNMDVRGARAGQGQAPAEDLPYCSGLLKYFESHGLLATFLSSLFKLASCQHVTLLLPAIARLLVVLRNLLIDASRCGNARGPEGKEPGRDKDSGSIRTNGTLMQQMLDFSGYETLGQLLVHISINVESRFHSPQALPETLALNTEDELFAGAYNASLSLTQGGEKSHSKDSASASASVSGADRQSWSSFHASGLGRAQPSRSQSLQHEEGGSWCCDDRGTPLEQEKARHARIEQARQMRKLVHLQVSFGRLSDMSVIIDLFCRPNAF